MFTASCIKSSSIWIRRLLLYPLLAILAFNTLLTGSPIPLWNIETLSKPVAVRQVADDHLVLEDGRQIRLPLITALPQSRSLFLSAIREGVEIQPDGEVFGLMWVDRNCAMDACVWRKRRVNLSALSAALNPDGVDSAVVPADAIQFLAENHRIKPRSSRPDRLDDYSLVHLREFRRQFDYSLEQRRIAELEPRPMSFAIPLH